MSSTSASVRVHYFASVRTTFGLSTEDFVLPTWPFRLDSLIQLIATKHAGKGSEKILAGCRWSVDNTLIEIEDIPEWELKGGEEVAAIPPVSGG
ncbi:related to Molybdopterin synthase small subunit [Melanopsichium pennsylvanicum]|uniref:Related to Molybdopterin synthase small subunit n=2 Tax=Melanopsichium pennsylvanicum TaxID=63383 RepID=A0AAJ5C7Y7_9BASI|nr:related to Molybdopterin synthase small subunit [Melanopsichium pennsylvanicum 4]SNX87437.1 related to Molybdopterin synthase small subunit [Melanopsichium pennsylvanicum]